MAWRIFRIWQRNSRVWRKHFFSTLIGNLGEPFLFLLALGYGLGREIPSVSGLSYLQFIAPGLVASAVMYSSAFETTYGSYTRLSNQGTYEAILMTPVSVEELALGEILWGASKGMMSGIIMLAALPLFDVIPSPWTTGLLLVLFVEGIFFAALGLMMTALATTYEFFNYFISLLLTPLFLFSGIFFPLDTMAPATRTALHFLPLTPVVDLSRMLCYGKTEAVWLPYSTYLTIIAIGSAWVATKLLRRRLIQ